MQPERPRCVNRRQSFRNPWRALREKRSGCQPRRLGLEALEQRRLLAIDSLPVPLETVDSGAEKMCWWPPEASVSPSNPGTEDPVLITLAGEWPNSCVPGEPFAHPLIERIGSDIYLNTYAYLGICLDVITPWSVSGGLEPLPAGDYNVFASLYNWTTPTDIWLAEGPDQVTSFSVEPSPPAPPANLRLAPRSDTGVSDSDGITKAISPEVIWDPSPDPDVLGYELYFDGDRYWVTETSWVWPFDCFCPEGTHTVSVVAVNEAELRSEPVTYEFTVDYTGPRIVSHHPTGTIPEPVNEVFVRFDEPINEKTFTPEGVSVMAGMLEIYIPVTDISPTSSGAYRIRFESPPFEIDYHVMVWPHVEDLAGNLMDQDQDGVQGEAADDAYDATYVVAGLLPDLHELADSIEFGPNPVEPGDALHVGWTVTNGYPILDPLNPMPIFGPAVGPWQEAVFLSRDDVFDGDDLLLGKAVFEGVLRPAESRRFAKKFELPENLAPGKYHVIVYADYPTVDPVTGQMSGRVKETNEENNWGSGGRLLVGSRVIYVDADAAEGGDGSSWAGAFNHLQDALALAAAGDEIRVADGLYRPDRDADDPDGSGDREASFYLTNGVEIRGGYAGHGASEPNARDAATYETILSGDLAGDDGPDFLHNDENSYHVVIANGTDPATIMDGFTVTGGNADLEDVHDIGAGMYIDNGSPTLADCTFRDNVAENFAGGMYNSGGSPQLIGCDFIGNIGGGMFNSGNPVLVSCTFSDNSTHTSIMGGGMCDTGSSTLIGCIFVGNTDHGSTVNDGGGGMYSIGDPTLVNCIFSGNSADGRGGGILLRGSSATLTNCTFAANSATHGAALACDSYQQTEPSNIQLANCILWDGGDEIFNNDGSTIAVTYSDVQGDWPLPGNLNVDPLFVDADGEDNVAGTEDDDLHLAWGSPCIDAAMDAGVDTDIDGNLRPHDVPGVDNNGPLPEFDMGAYEYVGPACATIRGSKFNDLDGDGRWDDGEPGLEGWTIYLDADHNGQLDPDEFATTTDTRGNYSFPRLKPGAHTVAEVPQDGWQQTYPTAAPEAEFRVNTTTAGQQWHSATASDAAGNFAVAWQSDRGSNTDPNVHDSDVYLRLYDLHGTPLGPEFRVNTYSASDQTQPVVAMDADGDFVVAWRSESYPGEQGGIYARRYVAGGQPLGPEFRVGTNVSGNQTQPSVAMGPGGNFVVAWTGSRLDTNGSMDTDVFARVFDADGRPVSDQLPVNNLTAGPQDQPSVAVAPEGNFVIAWAGPATASQLSGNIHARTFKADGTPRGKQFVVDTERWGLSAAPSAAIDSRGNFTIVFNHDDFTDGPGYADVLGQMFNADGSRRGPQFQANSELLFASYNGRVAMAAGGTFIVTWTGDSWNEDRLDIYAKIYSANGTPAGEEFTVNTKPAGKQWNPAPAFGDAGTPIIAWTGRQENADADVFARRLADSGPGGVHRVVLDPGEVVDGVNFGNRLVEQLGAIRGSKFNDLDGDGVRENNEPGLEDWTIFLDRNHNGQLDPAGPDVLREIEPDDFGAGPIVDPLGQATLREGLSNTDVYSVPSQLDPDSASKRVFGNITEDGQLVDVWREETAVLEVSFAKGVQSITLDFIGSYRGMHQGMLRVYDGSGDLFEEKLTGEIWGLDSETLTISAPDNRIMRLEATGVADTAPMILDRLQYSTHATPGEPSTTTDARGDYQFTGLKPGTYTVAEVLRAGWRQTLPGPQARLLDPHSRQVGGAAALDFNLHEVVAHASPRQGLSVDLTVEVLWSSTNYHLLPRATTYRVTGDEIFVDLYAAVEEVGLPVLSTEYETISIAGLRAGKYFVSATLHEPCGSMLPAFEPTWVATGAMSLQAAGRHSVILEQGGSVDDVDFGNRREPLVVDRHIFYNDSHWDGAYKSADGQDDVAIAGGKQALLPGQTATYANYTNYASGINGIMVDLGGLPDDAALTTDDFRFRVGNGNDPSAWTAAPDPIDISVRSGGGTDGSHRVTLIWDDFAIVNQWLQVSVLAGESTGLAEDDVFYFGNAVGDTGNSSTDAKVNAIDLLLTRDNPHNLVNRAPLACKYDYNRDARVNATDMLIARTNQTHFLNALELITVPEEPHEPGAVTKLLSTPAAREVLGEEFDWLYEFDPAAWQPSSDDDNSSEEAVEEALTNYLGLVTE